jgi:hypothetical protein
VESIIGYFLIIVEKSVLRRKLEKKGQSLAICFPQKTGKQMGGVS